MLNAAIARGEVEPGIDAKLLVGTMAGAVHITGVSCWRASRAKTLGGDCGCCALWGFVCSRTAGHSLSLVEGALFQTNSYAVRLWRAVCRALDVGVRWGEASCVRDGSRGADTGAVRCVLDIAVGLGKSGRRAGRESSKNHLVVLSITIA